MSFSLKANRHTPFVKYGLNTYQDPSSKPASSSSFSLDGVCSTDSFVSVTPLLELSRIFDKNIVVIDEIKK